MIKKIFVILFAVFIFTAGFVYAGTVQLPQTGQTKCYNSGSGAEIPCAGTGQDGEILAGVPWPDPRFTIGTGAEADCITDNLTGLMWPMNGNLGGTMVWYVAIDYATNLTLCGHSDWRLPNVNELESLVNAEEPNIGVWLNSQGFYNVQSDFYWSSTTLAYETVRTWVVLMWYGYVGSRSKDENYYVWPVRSGDVGVIELPQTGQTTSYRNGDDGDLEIGVAWPNPRFEVNGDCVTDNLTGLIWAKNADLTGNKTWQQALDYVNNMNLCGYSDWRLPNRKELMSLIDRSQYYPALPLGHPFTNVQSDYYWSSTTNAYFTSGAWIVFMWYGHVGYDVKNNSHDVWAVRSGQAGSFDVSGCVELDSSPLVKSRIILKQIGELNQTTTTDSSGCYGFADAVSGKAFTTQVNGPVPGTPVIQGCAYLQGSPMADRKVILKQNNELNKTTKTGADGCYGFTNAVPDKKFKLLIKGPVVP